MRSQVLVLIGLIAAVITSKGLVAQDSKEEFPNTQKEAIPFTAPHKALEMMEVPEGFEVTLFAHEPDIHQPIAMKFDSRGRLWVVENYTYSDRKENFNEELCDRVVIFEDKDNDGKFDERKIFWDQGKKLTGIELGRGGVWLTAAPNFIFIPDADRDDVPDGPAKVILDGFEDDVIRHNFVNGLRWGPDGWLYSRHGIQAVSYVGKPGEPKSKRTPMNCCVWRYHPERDVFEIVAEGGTNFWGLDFDENGEMFVINTVIGHLFHIVPGARYNRMHGAHFNPYTWQTIDQTADHVHWDTNEMWWDAKDALKGEGGEVSTGTDAAGGGHAHSGFMIYQGDNWPDEFRGRAFTLNFHGRRMNQEIIKREGNSYVAKHAPDMFRTSDPWFRGVELSYGPDGAVYVLDWSDIGECHENDGVHRTSGRIFKISYGKPKKPGFKDLHTLSDEDLIELFGHKNEWYARMSQRVLVDRYVAKIAKLKEAKTWPKLDIYQKLSDLAAKPNVDARLKLRALTTYHQISSVSHIDQRLENSWYPLLAAEADESCRAWSIRLLLDGTGQAGMNRPAAVRKMAEDPSSLVRLYAASALGKLESDDAFAVARKLVSYEKDMMDRVQPKLIWQRLEPFIVGDFYKSIAIFKASKSQLIRRNIVRRLACDPEQQSLMRQRLVMFLMNGCESNHADVLRGIKMAIEGRRNIGAPPSWPKLVESSGSLDAECQKLIEEISPVFGDGVSLDRLKELAVDRQADATARRAAIIAIGQYGDPKELFSLLKGGIKDRLVSPAVVKTLALSDDKEVPNAILNQYQWLPEEAQENAMDTLCSRKAWANRLLTAIEKGRLKSNRLTASHARQIQMFEDEKLTEKLGKVWGKVRETDQERLTQIEELRELMSDVKMTGAESTAIGKKMFTTHCASCHALFGEGGNIGPDLTGADRKNLNYLLENIVDPSATVATNFRTSVLEIDDGRLLSGVVMENNGQTLKLQTKDELLVLDVDAIENTKQTELSLMPDGLLDSLGDAEKIELFRYLMSR